jgi:hypothetical protein
VNVPSTVALSSTVLVLLATASCDAPMDKANPVAPPDPSLGRFTLDLPPLPSFVSPAEAAAAPNLWFPLVPGIVWTYEAETEDGQETTLDLVTAGTKFVDGVETTIIRDEVYLEGELIELTVDFHAQDTEGNVWYLGEVSCEWEPGEYVEGDEDEPDCGASGDPAGSWEAGVDGAEAGIIMWATPLLHKGKTYRQEYYEDEAEDMGKVLHGGLVVTVPAGTFTDCIETMDFSPLDPGAREHKFYCAGYGRVLEVNPSGGRIRNELVDSEGLPVIFN